MTTNPTSEKSEDGEEFLHFELQGEVFALEAMIVRVARGDGGDAAPDAKRRRREK